MHDRARNVRGLLGPGAEARGRIRHGKLLRAPGVQEVFFFCTQLHLDLALLLAGAVLISAGSPLFRTLGSWDQMHTASSEVSQFEQL